MNSLTIDVRSLPVSPKIKELKVKSPESYITKSCLKPSILHINMKCLLSFMYGKCMIYSSTLDITCPNKVIRCDPKNKYLCQEHKQFLHLIEKDIKIMCANYDHIDFSNLNRFEIISEINKIRENLAAKKIEANNNIAVNTNLNVTQFFEKIRYSGGESFLRSLDGDYAFGLYSVGNGKFETYLLLKVNNFDLAFKSILDWEKYLPIDFKDIFIGNNQILTLPVVASTAATTTATTTIKYRKSNTPVFIDKILKNYDIREYVSNENNLDIIYAFINNKYLLITSGETSFIDIKNRLLKENVAR